MCVCDFDMLLEVSPTAARYRPDAGLRLGYMGTGYVCPLVTPKLDIQSLCSHTVGCVCFRLALVVYLEVELQTLDRFSLDRSALRFVPLGWENV